MSHPMKGLYNVEVVNRFTRKIYEVHYVKSIGGVLEIQDTTTLIHPWKKVVLYPLWDHEAQIEGTKRIGRPSMKVRLGDMSTEDRREYIYYKRLLSDLNAWGIYLLKERAFKTIETIEKEYRR